MIENEVLLLLFALFSPESDFHFFLWFAYSDKAEHFQVVSTNKIKNIFMIEK